MQEQLYKDQLQQHELLLEETQKTSLQHAQALNQLEITDQSRQSAESSVDQLKIDLAKTKVLNWISVHLYSLYLHPFGKTISYALVSDMLSHFKCFVL